MRYIKTFGPCVLAVVALAALTASAASAEAPEFGRCIKKAKAERAGFSDAGCTKAVSTRAKYEWTSTILKNKFNGHMTGPLATLKTVPGAAFGSTKLTCTAEKSKGAEYSGPKTIANMILEFSGCETSGLKCGNVEGGARGKITTNKLEGVVGVEGVGTSPALNKLEVQLGGPGHGPLAEFECRPSPKFVVSGCVAHPVATDKMLLTSSEKFTASQGEQKPDKFAGGPTDECALGSSVNGGAPEEAGLTFTAQIEGEEKIEASSVN
ncbi:MAG: hypothetical protein M3Z95_00310 [Actinomycetota bacterium]|nr:hypothetical protein [Actinomycetota bacterium]